MQRFLTGARWDDDALIERRQEYLASGLGHPKAVWLPDGSDFPKQGRKPAGLARQYCGRPGGVANCQAGMLLAYASPWGRALVEVRAVAQQLHQSQPFHTPRQASSGNPASHRCTDRQGPKGEQEPASRHL